MNKATKNTIAMVLLALGIVAAIALIILTIRDKADLSSTEFSVRMIIYLLYIASTGNALRIISRRSRAN